MRQTFHKLIVGFSCCACIAFAQTPPDNSKVSKSDRQPSAVTASALTVTYRAATVMERRSAAFFNELIAGESTR